VKYCFADISPSRADPEVSLNCSVVTELRVRPEMTYEIGSKGSIVTEQFGKELSVFYRDGQSLLMTHFCNAGNQPRLRLRENTRPGVFEFQMFDITNLQSADADHVERVVYRIIDDKTMDLEIVWKNGKSEESEKYTLTRIDPEKHVGN
jgi:hypothetical protein